MVLTLDCSNQMIPASLYNCDDGSADLFTYPYTGNFFPVSNV